MIDERQVAGGADGASVLDGGSESFRSPAGGHPPGHYEPTPTTLPPKLAALKEFLYPTPARRSVGSILAWWERRRIPYNLIVGSAGVVSVAVASLFAALPPLGFDFFMGGGLPAILVVGVLANLCYLLGPATEILMEKMWGREVLPTGPALYRMGLTFSVGLVMLPALLMIIVWIVRIVSVVV